MTLYTSLFAAHYRCCEVGCLMGRMVVRSTVFLPLATLLLSRTLAVLHNLRLPNFILDVGDTFQPEAYVPAFVVSNNDARWEHAQSVLGACGLHAQRVWPETFATARVYLADAFRFPEPPSALVMRMTSLQLSFRGIARRIATDLGLDDKLGYGLVFEDDVALNELVRAADVRDIVARVAAASRDIGHFSLGLCYPQCRRFDAATFKGVEVSRCKGYCMHAYGLFKWRAGNFWEDVANHTVRLCLQRTHGCNFVDLVAPDVLSMAASNDAPSDAWPLLAGSNLAQHEQGGGDVNAGTGLFYQANRVYPSRMWDVELSASELGRPG